MENKSLEKTENTDKKQAKPWLYKKGESGNPAGKPAGTLSLVSILKAKLAQTLKTSGKKAAEELVDIWIQTAMNKKDTKFFEALKSIVQYTDGMPKQSFDFPAGINISFDPAFRERGTK